MKINENSFGIIFSNAGRREGEYIHCEGIGFCHVVERDKTILRNRDTGGASNKVDEFGDSR